MANSPIPPEVLFTEHPNIKVTTDGQVDDRHLLFPDSDGNIVSMEPLHHDRSLPTIGEDGDVFTNEEEDTKLPRNLSDPMPEESQLHNISRRVSTVSSQEDG